MKGGKAACVCNISAEKLKVGGDAVTRRLHGVLTAVCHFDIIPSDWKRGLVVSSEMENGTVKTATTYGILHCSACKARLCSSVAHTQWQSAAEAADLNSQGSRLANRQLTVSMRCVYWLTADTNVDSL